MKQNLFLQNDHTKKSCFNLPLVKLDDENNFIIFQSKKCFNVAPAQLCVHLSDYAVEIN